PPYAVDPAAGPLPQGAGPDERGERRDARHLHREEHRGGARPGAGADPGGAPRELTGSRGGPLCPHRSRNGCRAPQVLAWGARRFAYPQLRRVHAAREGRGTRHSMTDPVTLDSIAPIGEFDEKRAQNAVRELVIAVGEEPDREGMQETPARVARAYREIFAGLWQKPEDVLTTTFDLGHDEMVLVKDIEVLSHCEHHLVPFVGVALVGYIPSVDGKITGLSKLVRLVDVYARRPQVQERLTTQVADSLMEILEPRGVIVVVECEHMCMSMRGVRKPGAKTITSAVRGQLRDPATRNEAMSLIMAH